MDPALPISCPSNTQSIMHLERSNEEGAECNHVALPGNEATNTSTIPLIIVDFVCDTIWEVMKFQEGLMDFPTPLDKMQFARPGPQTSAGLPEGRQLLKTMSLDHRDWTDPAQDSLRRRTGIHCQAELERFLGSSFCGKWVQELQCVMGTRFVRSIMRGYPVNLFNTLRLVFSELPYLCALYLAMDVWSWVPGSTFIPSVLTFIPSVLQSLHVHLHEWTDDSLCQLFDTVSNLHYLHTLSIVGSRFIEVRQSPLVAQGSPPVLLKRLLLEFRSLSRWLNPLLSWLFVPRGCYSLHELRLRQISSSYYEDENTVQTLLPILMPALSDLKVLEVRLPKLVLDLPSMFYCPQWFQSLVQRCTSLEELHANVIDVPVSVLQLSVTLQHLHVFKSFDADDSTVSDDERIVKILMPLLRHCNLRSVVASELNVGKNLSRTERLCNEAGVEYTVT